MFMVKKITKSDEMVGLTGAFETIPYLLLGPYAGVLADRIDRKKIMLWSDLVSAFVLSGFGTYVGLGYSVPGWLILSLAFVLSSIRCFFMPAKGAAVPAMVPSNLVMKANSLSMATQNFMPLIGLTITASVLAVLYASSPQWFFFGVVVINALSFFGSAYFINLLPSILPERSEVAESHPIRDFMDGIRYVRKRHELTVLVALTTVFRLSVAPFFVTYVAANDQWWGGPKHEGSPSTLAWMEISFFIGMVISFPIIGKLKTVRPALWFSWSLLVIAICIGLMAFSKNFWLFFGWNVICGLSVPMADLPMATYMQVSVPDAFRGRTNSVLNMIATGVMPIGTVLGGFFITKIGITMSFLLMSMGMASACLIGLLDPRFRNVRMPEEAVS